MGKRGLAMQDHNGAILERDYFYREDSLKVTQSLLSYLSERRY